VRDVYVLPQGPREEKAIVAKYPAAGLRLEKVATVETQRREGPPGQTREQVVYRVERPGTGNG